MALTAGGIRGRMLRLSRTPFLMGEGVGLALIVMGGLGCLGWLLRVPLFVQPSPDSPPLLANTAIALVSSGVGLYGLVRGRRAWAVGGALVAGAIGGVALAQYLTGYDLGIDRLLFRSVPGLEVPPGFRPRMPVSTALGLALAGLAVLALAMRHRDMGRLIAGVLGSVMLALFASIFLGRITGLLDGVQFGLLVGTSLQGGIGFLLLGITLLTLAWTGETSPGLVPRWLPFSVFLASLVTVLFLWKALVNRERDALKKQVALASASGRQDVLRQTSMVLRTIRRVAVFTATFDGLVATWVRDVGTLPPDIDGLEAVVWADDAGFMQAMVPANADASKLLGEIRWRRPEADSSGNDIQVYSLRLRPGFFGARVPVCRPPGCTGQIVALFDAAKLLSPELADTNAGYHYAIAFAGRTLYRTAAPEPDLMRWAQRSSVAVSGTQWKLDVWPARDTLLRARSTLPEVVLVLGLVVTGLMPVTLRLAQTNWDAARRAERARLSLALERATDGIWEWDVPGGQVVRSAGLWRHLEYDPDVMGTRVEAWTSLIHPEDEAKVRAAMAAHLAGRTETFEAEYRIRNARGGWHHIVDRGRAVQRAPSGDALRVLGITADVTDRKRADEAREASERRFRAMFDSALQFQALLDLDGRFLEVNRTALEFAGVRLEDVRGRPVWDAPWWVQTPEARARLQQACQDATAGRTVRYEVETVGKDGRPGIVDFSLRPVLDADGRVAQLLAEGRDVTDRKRAEAALREVGTLSTMGRLAARVAHEINNPLAGIQNAFLLVKDAIPPDHRHAAYVGAIEREISRIAAVTRQLYETYRPEEDGKGAASVHMVVGDAVTFLGQVNRGTQVRIETDLARAPASVPVPDALLRQAVYNLVQNAVEASPPGGVVRVSARTEDGIFILGVRDEGPGVPAEMRERIFEEGFTTKGSGVKTGGMGIGLTLVRRSVEALGGRIDIVDPAGGGTEFVVRLPLHPIASGDRA
ncbi:MAG: PAS domain S-box protein [Gemmatimonadota bacterium]